MKTEEYEELIDEVLRDEKLGSIDLISDTE